MIEETQMEQMPLSLEETPEQENPFAVPDLTGDEPQLAGGKIDLVKSVLGKSKKAKRTKEAPTLSLHTDEVVDVDAVKAAEKVGAVAGKPPETIFNLNKIEGADDFKAHLDGVANTYGAGDIEKMSYKELAAKTSEMGYSEKFVADIINPSKATKADPKEVYKMMLVLTDASKRTHELGKKLDEAARTGAETPDMMVEFKQAIAYEGLVARRIKQRQADVARSLGILSQARNANVERGFALDEVLSMSGKKGDAVALARAYMSAGGTEKSLALAESITAPGIMGRVKDVWFSTWINGLLSAPPTHIKNMGANTIFAGMATVEKGLASAIGNVRHALTGSPDYIKGQELLVDALSTKQALQEAMSLSVEAFKQNKQLTGVSKLETGPVYNPFRIEVAEDASSLTKGSAKGFEYWGKFVTAPGRALMAEDEFFKSFHYRKHLNSLAYRQSSAEYDNMLKAGIDPAEAEKAAETIAGDILAGRNLTANEEALQFAGQMTFTNPLEGGLRSMEKVAQRPLIKIFVPFIRTPTNIAIELNKRSPTTFFSKQTRADWAAGGIKRDMVIAKASMGSMFMYGVGSMALDGHITGAGPYALDERKNMVAQGWQPYSFVFDASKVDKERIAKLEELGLKTSKYEGKIYASYAGYEPIGALLGIGASIGEYGVMEPDASAMEQLMTGGTLASLDYMSNLPMVAGVSEITNLFRTSHDIDENTRVDLLTKRLTEQAAEFGIGGSPIGAYSSMLAYTNRIFSGEKPDPRSSAEDYADLKAPVRAVLDSINRYASRNPFIKSDAPTQLDSITGQEKTYPVPEAWMRALPISITKGKYSPAHGVLEMYGIGQYNPSKKIKGVELNSVQYQRYIELATGPDEDGVTLESAVVSLANDPDFQAYTKEMPIEAQRELRSVISDRYAVAKEKVMEEFALGVIAGEKKADKEAKILKKIEEMQ